MPISNLNLKRRDLLKLSSAGLLSGVSVPWFESLAVHDPREGLENLAPTGTDLDARLELLSRSEQRFSEQNRKAIVGAKQAAFNRAVRLMRSKRSKAFHLDEEPESLRESYGYHRFGQSCLLARRLVEAGVSFVEIFHRGWDDHEGAAKRIAERAPWMDAGMATLIRDLKVRGMLDDTLIVWMGEFGRSPGNGNGHFCKAWSSVFAGGGLKTGQVVGKTSEGGKNPGGEVVDRIEELGGTVRYLIAKRDALEVDFRFAGIVLNDEHLQYVNVLENVAMLRLKRTPITDAGLVHVGRIATLKRLYLEQTAISDSGLAHLAKLLELEFLNLYGTAISDTGARRMAALPMLKTLIVSETNVTTNGIDALKKAAPQLRVVPDPAEDLRRARIVMDVAKKLLAAAEDKLAARQRDLKELAPRAAELKKEEEGASLES